MRQKRDQRHSAPLQPLLLGQWDSNGNKEIVGWSLFKQTKTSGSFVRVRPYSDCPVNLEAGVSTPRGPRLDVPKLPVISIHTRGTLEIFLGIWKEKACFALLFAVGMCSVKNTFRGVRIFGHPNFQVQQKLSYKRQCLKWIQMVFWGAQCKLLQRTHSALHATLSHKTSAARNGQPILID